MAEITSGLTTQSLDPGAALATAEDPSCGAVASFVGTVRQTPAVSGSAGRTVLALEYEAHTELAERRLAEICEEAAERWGLAKVVALHRLGRCELGDPTVVIACSAPHRREALAACTWLIDTLKATVPIFKKEIYDDGSAWVGSGA